MTVENETVDALAKKTQGEFDTESMSELLERESRRYNRKLEEEEEAKRR